MSWSTHTPEPQGRNEPLNMTPFALPSAECQDSYNDQFQAALKALVALAAAIGRPEDKIHISMSGHANPDHAPVDGWGPEFITVTVTAAPEK